MSASSKKKIRKEQEEVKLTQRQLQEQKEAKKNKLITSLFIAVLALIAVAFIAIMITNIITTSGFVGKTTTVATVGDDKISLTDFNYYYIDAVNELTDSWYSSVSSITEATEMSYEEAILNMTGVDVTKPISELIYDEETGETWAEYMIDEALATAQRDYILYNAAKAAGFELSAEDQETVDQISTNLENYASWTNYGSATAYLRDAFGYGKYATVKSYVAYVERGMIADAYYEHYSEQLSYDDAALRKAEGDTPEDYNSYSYAYYTVDVENFLEGGTAADDGTTTYSEAEKEAARAAAEKAANELAEAKTIDEFDDLVAHIYITDDTAEDTDEDTTAEATEDAATDAAEDTADESEEAVTEEEEIAVENEHDHDHETAIKSTNVLHSSSKTDFREWLAADTTVEDSTTVIPVKDSETEEVTGYYVVYLMMKTDNNIATSDVRHLLVQVENTDDEAEWTAALAEAEELLKQWESGDKTEDSFIELVHDNTDDSDSAETGGLYENVNENSSYVENFLNWSIDAERRSGDTGIVETEYGYHIMYYVDRDELSYRDQMISDELRAEDTQTWITGLTEKTAINKNQKGLKKFDPDMANLQSAYY